MLALWSRTVKFGYFAGIAEQRLELGQACVLQIFPLVSLSINWVLNMVSSCFCGAQKVLSEGPGPEGPTPSSDHLQNQLVDVRQAHVSGGSGGACSRGLCG